MRLALAAGGAFLVVRRRIGVVGLGVLALLILGAVVVAFPLVLVVLLGLATANLVEVTVLVTLRAVCGLGVAASVLVVLGGAADRAGVLPLGLVLVLVLVVGLGGSLDGLSLIFRVEGGALLLPLSYHPVSCLLLDVLSLGVDELECLGLELSVLEAAEDATSQD